jgi:dipeptidyl-peptidase-4
MLSRLKFLNTLFIVAIVNLSVQAQKKELGNDQYFKNNFTDIIQPLPVFNKWIDDTHFILLRKGSRFTVDARTGEEVATIDESISSKSMDTTKGTISTKEGNLFFKINGKEIQLTNDKEKKSNATLSPDNKYIAFTKNNDLYTIEINSKKVNRLTTDGSKLILNGYASWVYMEEILGRSSQYRSYWWSPDSKKIAFFRSDDTKVPEFVITNAK